jgi:hypothetical protein
LRVSDPRLGPNSLLTVRTSRTERQCPASAGGGACVSVQITLLPDKVTVQAAIEKLAGFADPRARVVAYRVEDRLVLLARTTNRRVLEFSSEQRGTTTIAVGDQESQIEDFEQRSYRF